MTRPMATDPASNSPFAADEAEYDEPAEGLVGAFDLLTWIGESKRLIAVVTLAAGLVAVGATLLMSDVFTAQATLLPPNSQQQGGSMAAIAALSSLGSLGGLAGGLGGAKSPDELYVALLKSDSVQRVLAEHFNLANRWEVETYEVLRRKFPVFVRIGSDKKSGLISIEVDDKDPAFAAQLANAYADEVTKLLGRLAVSEAQLRRAFFEQQLKDTKERLVAAEVAMIKVQETSGVIVLDKQAEALIGGAAQLRAQISEREVMLNVLRRTATEKNPDVQRLSAEVSALRGELARMESSPEGQKASTFDMPLNKLTGGGLEYIRALRELKIQEALLESILKQFELAKLDEAKDGPSLQRVDIALPPDRKSKPQRALIVLGSMLLAALATIGWVVWRRYSAVAREADPAANDAWVRLGQAWRFRR